MPGQSLAHAGASIAGAAGIRREVRDIAGSGGKAWGCANGPSAPGRRTWGIRKRLLFQSFGSPDIKPCGQSLTGNEMQGWPAGPRSLLRRSFSPRRRSAASLPELRRQVLLRQQLYLKGNLATDGYAPAYPADLGAIVAGESVHHGNVAKPEGRREALLGPGAEVPAVGRLAEDKWRRESAGTKSALAGHVKAARRKWFRYSGTRRDQKECWIKG